MSVVLLLVSAGWPAVLGAGQNNSLIQRGNTRPALRPVPNRVSGEPYGYVSVPHDRVISAAIGPIPPMGPMTPPDAMGYGNNFMLGGENTGTAAPRSSALQASWLTVDEQKPKDIRVHDLVTIVVNEVSTHMVQADAETEREQSINAALTDWISLSGWDLRPDQQSQGDPKVKASINREFEGESDIKRKDSLSYRIQAEVIDVLPNGNLVLEATKTVSVDEETTSITLTGQCRSQDVGIDNTITSSKLAKLSTKKYHTGMARDTVKRGFLTKLFDFLSPF